MAKLRYERDPDTEKLVRKIVVCLRLDWIDPTRVYVVKSRKSASNAIARIYGLPKVFQVSLGFEPCYVIELISEKFDRLPEEEKIKVLLHELMHIPKTFSGGLRPHGRYTSKRTIDKLYAMLRDAKKSGSC
jgi:predicted metallopeptidase